MSGGAPPGDFEPVVTTTAWRLVADEVASGFAWDVRRLRFFGNGAEAGGVLSASGDAGAGFEVDNAVCDSELVWGGRPDTTNKFHLTFEPESTSAPVDRIILDQPTRHWARSVTLERRSDDHEWHRVRRFAGLQLGCNELYPDAESNGAADRSDPPTSRRARRGTPSPPPSVEFGPFDDRRIMVSIASYRDPELPNTIANALSQAAYPEHLRFAICHQFDDETAGLLERWDDDPRFSIDAVHHSESHGCCWARNRCFGLFDGEPYLLQIDAHTRFAARWDARFIDMLESTDSDLPVLTTYPSRYTVGDDGEAVHDIDAGVQRLYIAEVRPDLTTLQRTRPPNDLSRPGPCPTLAAGLIFTRGRFCRDVDYDPGIYFAGEEISLAARAFTSGYDLYHPTETLVWHLYDHDHPKHWEDHDTHAASHADAVGRLRTLFQGDSSSLGRYGLGSARSLAEFERFAGIDLGASRAEADGRTTITIDRSVIEPRDDYGVFVIVLLDAEGSEVYRHDVHAADVLDLSRSTVTLHDVPESAEQFLVLTITRGGRVGEVTVRSMPGVRSGVPAGRVVHR